MQKSAAAPCSVILPSLPLHLYALYSEIPWNKLPPVYAMSPFLIPEELQSFWNEQANTTGAPGWLGLNLHVLNWRELGTWEVKASCQHANGQVTLLGIDTLGPIYPTQGEMKEVKQRISQKNLETNIQMWTRARSGSHCRLWWGIFSISTTHLRSEAQQNPAFGVSCNKGCTPC